MSFLYLAALVIAIGCMILLDVRLGLFFRVSPARATVVMAVGILFFLAWDVAGITQGIFFRGNPGLLTGVLIAPELPLEEVFFLILLCYTTMNLYGFFAARWVRSARLGRSRIETGSADE